MAKVKIKALLFSLIFVFVTSFFPVVCQIAYGADEKTTSEVLFDLKILKGDAAGNLMEEQNVTRAEITAILCRTAGLSESSFAEFNDVSENHWAYGYISEMTKRGIVNGYENNVFKPENNVTFAEAVKMVLGILEINDNGFSFPDDYMITGAERGVTEGIEAIASDYLSREEVSKLIYNALYIEKTDKTSLSEKLGVNVIYVSKKGTKEATGDKDSPYYSISEALSVAKKGSVILLDEGKYVLKEKLLIDKSGIDENLPLVITPMPYKNVEIILKNDASIEIDENSAFVKFYKISVTKEENASVFDVNGNNFTLSECAVNGGTVNIKGDNAKIQNNKFDTAKNALILKNVDNTIVSGNVFNNITFDCLQVSGKSENTQISNNTFNIAEIQSGFAIHCMGDTENSLKNTLLWNNVIYTEFGCEGAGAIRIQNTENVSFHNNIIDGTERAVVFEGNNKSVSSKNNIFYGCGGNAYELGKSKTELVSDYNCYYSTYPIVMETNSIFTDPYFVSRGYNWKLMSDSAALNAGETAQNELLSFDFNGKKREDNPHMGIYAEGSEETASREDTSASDENIIFSTDFRKGADGMINAGGEWKASKGIYFQNSTASARSSVCYNGGLSWKNYEISADVQAPSAIEGNSTGIIFRSDAAMKNMYAFRFLSENMIEFVKWQNNSFSSIQKWQYNFEPDAMYNLKVRAEGDSFTFFVNGEQVREVTDSSFLSGTVGFYCFRESNQYDNIKVVAID